MNLNNLSMNYKIILGISTVTILTFIYQYIKNIFNPNKRLLEGQELNRDKILDESIRFSEKNKKSQNQNVSSVKSHFK